MNRKRNENEVFFDNRWNIKFTEVEKENIKLEDRIYNLCDELGLPGDEYINMMYKENVSKLLKLREDAKVLRGMDHSFRICISSGEEEED